ncbi:MAG: right-handed parallel beta-helix repeat-containing protein [Spirulinaceae cyanobacterium]
MIPDNQPRGIAQKLQTSIFRSLVVILPLLPFPALAQDNTQFEVIVNSNLDEIIADENLTLREAIAIVNGDLDLNALSTAEESQISGNLSDLNKQISFNLPPDQTTITLTELLPEIRTPNVTLDGTTQPGYEGFEELREGIPTPVVTLTRIPVDRNETLLNPPIRGLTLVADNITVQGLRFYGFTAPPAGDTATVPAADIFISAPQAPRDEIRYDVPANPGEGNSPPQNILIKYNILGVPPEETTATQSAFGVYIFNGENVGIINNIIANHQGSGIISSIRANDLVIGDNIIENNGLIGMPDGIHLEGEIANTRIQGNLIRNNGGSGIYIFKPEGAVTIDNNVLNNNGARYQRPAIYLSGSNHQVTNNRIANQPGAGVVVAGYPVPHRVSITNNNFVNVAGLPIDLNAQPETGRQDRYNGDGRNAIADTALSDDSRELVEGDRFRRQIANYGIMTPQFVSRELFRNATGEVTLFGMSEPNATIEIYRVVPDIDGDNIFPVTTTEADDKGRFEIRLRDIQVGERVSAIATHPDYGTSEPALNATIGDIPSISGEAN